MWPRHEILMDGDVRVDFGPRGIRHVVSRADLRRFAWAVLADLDPVEAAKAGEEEMTALHALTGRTITMAERVLCALIAGPMSASRVAAELAIPRDQAAAYLSTLRGQGEVDRTLDGKRRATWFLTRREGAR